MFNPNAEPCVSLPTLAKHFGISRTTAFKAVRNGELPALRLGNLYRIRMSEVPQLLIDRWTAERTTVRSDLPLGQMVYFLTGASGFVKIGFTTDLSRRVSELQPGSPVRLELLASLPGGVFADERQYHKRFHSDRAEGEWFRRSPEIDAEIERLSTTERIRARG